MYGDEEAGIPPEELYTKIDGEKALTYAEKVLGIVERLLKEATSKEHNR